MIPTSPQKWAAYTSSTVGERFLSALRLLLPWLARHRRRLASAVLLAVITVLAGVGLFSVAGGFLTGAFLAGASIAFDLFAASALVRGLSFLRLCLRYRSAERSVGKRC